MITKTKMHCFHLGIRKAPGESMLNTSTIGGTKPIAWLKLIWTIFFTQIRSGPQTPHSRDDVSSSTIWSRPFCFTGHRAVRFEKVEQSCLQSIFLCIIQHLLIFGEKVKLKHEFSTIRAKFFIYASKCKQISGETHRRAWANGTARIIDSIWSEL